MNYRKLGKYPPYFFLINFTIAHQDMKKVMEASKHIHQILVQHISDKAFVLGLFILDNAAGDGPKTNALSDMCCTKI